MPKPKRLAIWFDPEAAAELNAVMDELANTLGFRPTASQTIRYILRNRQPLDEPQKPVSVP
jgi:hypothetical protein